MGRKAINRLIRSRNTILENILELDVESGVRIKPSKPQYKVDRSLTKLLSALPRHQLVAFRNSLGLGVPVLNLLLKTQRNLRELRSHVSRKSIRSHYDIAALVNLVICLRKSKDATITFEGEDGMRFLETIVHYTQGLLQLSLPLKYGYQNAIMFKNLDTETHVIQAELSTPYSP